jgi:metal-responsive CopG/Arc/MetJ family transcriptional regulator
VGRRNVTLPEELMRRVDRVVSHEALGFDSPTEYVRAAVRERVREDEEYLSMLAEAESPRIGGGEKPPAKSK